MARAGQRRGRDPVVTVVDRRRPVHLGRRRQPAAGARRSAAAGARRDASQPRRVAGARAARRRSRRARLKPARAERHRSHRAPDGPVRRAPARDPARDGDHARRRQPVPGGHAPRALRRAARQRRARGRAERGHRSRSRPATSSTSPTTRSCRVRASSRCRPARGSARPARRATVRRGARRPSCATRRSCATTTSVRGRARQRAAIDVLIAQRGRRRRSPPARPGAASCGRARATRPSPIRSCWRDPGEVRVVSKVDRHGRGRGSRRDVHARRRARAGRGRPARAAGSGVMADTLRSLAGDRLQAARRHLGAARAAQARGARPRSLRLPAARAHGHRRRAERAVRLDAADARDGGHARAGHRRSRRARRRDDRPRLRPRRRDRDRSAAGDPRVSEGRRRQRRGRRPRRTSSSIGPTCRGCSRPRVRTRRAASFRGSRSSSPSAATSTGASGAAPSAPRASAATSCSRSATRGRGRTRRSWARRAPTPEAEPTLERRLSESNAAHNLSRLVCPRRLDDHTAYVACVVPTFLAGVQAGLGLDAASDARAGVGHEGQLRGRRSVRHDRAAGLLLVELRHRRRKATSRASRASCKPAVAPPGRRTPPRRCHARRGPDLALDADDPGAEIVVDRARSCRRRRRRASRLEQWPTEAQQHWEPAVTDDARRASSTAPDAQAHAPNPGPPVVGPPLYGGTHARQPRIETEAPAAAAQPQWFRELNLDPRHRIVGGPRHARRAGRAGGPDARGLEPGDRRSRRPTARCAWRSWPSTSARRCIARHLSRFTDAAVVSVTERVHAEGARRRRSAASGRRSRTRACRSSVTDRRLPAADPRCAGRSSRAAVAARGRSGAAAVEALTVRDDRLTTDWVRVYKSPGRRPRPRRDRARHASPISVAAQIAPGVDRRHAAARSGDAELAKPGATGPPHAATRWRTRRFAGGVDLGRELAGVARPAASWRTMPTEREMERDPEAALTGAAHAMLLRASPTSRTRRACRDVRGPARRRRAAAASTPSGVAEDRGARARHARGAARAAPRGRSSSRAGTRSSIPFDEFERSAERLRATVAREPAARGRHGSSAALRGDRQQGRHRRPVRRSARATGSARRRWASWRSSTRAITVPARIVGRLHGGSGRMPGWLRPDWFDDLRVEPVMAHPRFEYPMYEPLHRYDREWMVPGLGLIQRPDMATLLADQQPLHRGLSRRPQPRDGAASCCGASSRPTSAAPTSRRSGPATPELVADMHELPWRSGALGSHVDPGARRPARVPRPRRPRSAATPASSRTRRVEARASDATASRSSTARASPVGRCSTSSCRRTCCWSGFGMTRARIDTPGETWWFTLSENPTEPRFGLDPVARRAARRATACLGRLRRERAGRVPRRRPSTRRPRVADGVAVGRVERAGRLPALPAAGARGVPGQRRWSRERCADGRSRAHPPGARRSGGRARAARQRSSPTTPTRSRRSARGSPRCRRRPTPTAIDAAAARIRALAERAPRRRRAIAATRTSACASSSSSCSARDDRARGRRPARAAAGARRGALDRGPARAARAHLPRRAARRVARRGPQRRRARRRASPTGTTVWASGDTAAPWPALVARRRRAPRAVGRRGAAADQPRRRGPAAPPQFPDDAGRAARRTAVARTLPDRFFVRIEQDGARAGRPARRRDPRRAAGRAHRSRRAHARCRSTTRTCRRSTSRCAGWSTTPRPSASAWRSPCRCRVPVRPVRRVLVYGVRAALDPTASAARLERLIRSHRFTDGAEFLAQGTPTNNTDSVRTEWSRRTPPGPPALDPPAALPIRRERRRHRARARPRSGGCWRRCRAPRTPSRRAPPPSTPRCGRRPGATRSSTSRRPGRANGDKRLDSPSLDAVRDHWVDHVRGRGPLPALRLGRQPYGLLPIVATDASWQPLRGGFVEDRLVPFIDQQVRWMWDDALAAVAHGHEPSRSTRRCRTSSAPTRCCAACACAPRCRPSRCERGDGADAAGPRRRRERAAGDQGAC